MKTITQDTLKKHRIELNKWTAERKQRQDEKENDKKIIDYGLSDKDGILAYIKYTS